MIVLVVMVILVLVIVIVITIIHPASSIRNISNKKLRVCLPVS